MEYYLEHLQKKDLELMKPNKQMEIRIEISKKERNNDKKA
jgi:hypothetical protein